MTKDEEPRIKLRKFGGRISVPISLEQEDYARLRRFYKRVDKLVRRAEERWADEFHQAIWGAEK